VFHRGGSKTTGASDTVKSLKVYDGYDWAVPRAESYSSYRELALMDFAACARVYKSAGVSIPADIDAVYDILVTNQLLTEKMKALEIQFESFVASIAGALSPRSGSNLGTLQAFMGRQPRKGVEDDGIYKFALQEYLGMDGTKEIWMKHFWTKMMANGMIGLLLAGGLQSCGPVTAIQDRFGILQLTTTTIQLHGGYITIVPILLVI
jgi:hypothetical protein